MAGTKERKDSEEKWGKREGGYRIKSDGTLGRSMSALELMRKFAHFSGELHSFYQIFTGVSDPKNRITEQTTSTFGESDGFETSK